jgi:hypothetical protein
LWRIVSFHPASAYLTVSVSPEVRGTLAVTSIPFVTGRPPYPVRLPLMGSPYSSGAPVTQR